MSIRRKFNLFTLIFYSFVSAFICIKFLQRTFWNDVFFSLTFRKENHQRILHHKSYPNFLKFSFLFAISFFFSYMKEEFPWNYFRWTFPSGMIRFAQIFLFEIKTNEKEDLYSIPLFRNHLWSFSHRLEIFSWFQLFHFLFLIVLLDIHPKSFSKIIKISSQNFWIRSFWLYFCVSVRWKIICGLSSSEKFIEKLHFFNTLLRLSINL